MSSAKPDEPDDAEHLPAHEIAGRVKDGTLTETEAGAILLGRARRRWWRREKKRKDSAEAA